MVIVPVDFFPSSVSNAIGGFCAGGLTVCSSYEIHLGMRMELKVRAVAGGFLVCQP